MKTGADRLISGDTGLPNSANVGLLCHQASLLSSGEHLLDALIRTKPGAVAAVFGPQHGIWGHTQDDMIEWEGYRDPRTELPIHSLYGVNRKPRREWLKSLDLLAVDLVDVGARYYTFIWTMALCMEACAEVGLPMKVLDRPNPIGGIQVEGTVLDPAFSCFVGLHPLPMRHGMTIGEIARYLKAIAYPNLDLEVAPSEDWRRDQYADESGAFWAPPSPNMPTVDTAVVYPGGCLIEGTNLSEGRGTTRPFETVGAPWLDAWAMAERLNSQELNGVFFRPIQFQPTFQKHAGQFCHGVFVHVTDRRVFRPVLSYVAILQAAFEFGGDSFAWKSPPYEYESVRLPFDILAGNDGLRNAIESGNPLCEIAARMDDECRSFEPLRQAAINGR